MNRWYTPAYTGDMFTQWGSFNIQANTAWADSITRPMLGQTPIYNFNNFCQYPNMAGNSYLTNPFFTLGQMSWQNTVNGGMPYFNDQGQFQAPWLNGMGMNNNWLGGMGWTPSGAGSSSITNLSEEELEYKTNYEVLLSLVKELSKYDGINYSEQAKLKAAISPIGKTWKEKFEALEKAYKKIDKETRKQFILENGYKIGTTKNINGKEDDNSFYNRLLDSGYEFTNVAAGVDDKISSLKDSIKSISNKNGNATNFENIVKSYDILDVVSSWNTKYASSSDNDEKRIINYIEKQFNAMDNKNELRETVITTAIYPLVDKLIAAVDDVKGSLDASSKEKIEKAVSNLTESKENSNKDGIDSNLSKYFDELYLLLRQASISNLRNDVLAYYGEVDSEVFTDDMFETETYKDLTKEGFDDSAIKGAGVTPIKNPTKPSVKKDDIDDKTTFEQVQQLQKANAIEEIAVKTVDNKTVYQETKKTGGRNYHRLYVIENDKLVELRNTHYVNGKLEAYDANLAQTKVEATPSDILEAYEEAKEVEQNAERVNASKNTAVVNGNFVAKELPKLTTSNYNRTLINNRLSELKEDNIVEFLSGYYDTRGYDKTEGLMELLDDENGKKIDMSNKKKILTSLVAKAKSLGITKENNPDYAAIEEFINKYNSNDYKDYKKFNDGDNRIWSGWPAGLRIGGAVVAAGITGFLLASNPVGWVVAGCALAAGAVLGLGAIDNITDNEVLDKHIESLFKEIKKLEAQKA